MSGKRLLLIALSLFLFSFNTLAQSQTTVKGRVTDPAELHAWLATVTNAQAVPDSEAYFWP